MSFNVAAETYDRFMGRFSQRLVGQMADLAGVASDQRVLDVGCGPGALTAELVRRLGAANVSAVDPSQPFVEAIRERLPGVEVQQATAEQLPFPAGSFDIAVAQLVVHFMADPVAGLVEMARVTKPGGRVAACVWDHHGGRGPLGLFWQVARQLDHGVEDESGLAGTRDGHLAELFEAAGLTSIERSVVKADLELPGFVTRAISARPATGSAMKWTTSWASAASKVASGNGRCSAAASRTSTPGNRSRTAATNGLDGSTAVTFAVPRRRPSSAVSAPGPQPTSITRWPAATSARSAICPTSRSEKRPMNRSYASAGTLKLTRRRYPADLAGVPGVGQFCEDRPMTRRGILLFALMSVILGIPYLFIRVAVAEITPAVLVFARTSVAALILLPIAIARVDLRAVLARWRWVVAFAAVEVAVPWVMLGSAEQHVSSSLAGLLIAGVPLVGTALALATGGTDRASRAGVFGLLIGLVGVLAIVGSDFEASDATALVQIAVVIVGYALGPAILSRRLGGLPSVGIMSLSLGLCAVVYLPIAVLQWPSAAPSANVLAAIEILAVVCTAAAFLVFAALIGEVGPVRATVITYVNPAVAAVLGVFVLNETFTVAMAIGFALVILGSTLATRQSRSSTGPAPAVVESARPVTVPEP